MRELLVGVEKIDEHCGDWSIIGSASASVGGGAGGIGSSSPRTGCSSYMGGSNGC